MPPLAAISLAARLVGLGTLGCVLGAAVNWAIYSWAWNPRPISPWSPPPTGKPPRSWRQRIPIFGWLLMRCEADVHGRGFWMRPLLIELLLGCAIAGLYWFEVEQRGLLGGQVLLTANGPPIALQDWAPEFRVDSGVLVAMFAAHVLLLVLMMIASFIDIDEKTIPDEVTVTGTLLGLACVAMYPGTLLPDVSERINPPIIATQLLDGIGKPAVGPLGASLVVEPVTPASPHEWPVAWAPAPEPRSLIIGLACYWLWCFALTPRIWRSSRGTWWALQLIAARVLREISRPLMATIAACGSLAITVVWLFGDAAWIGLLSALIGMIASGGLVWAVRIIGSAALGREAMGFGDVTLMMMIGTLIGWQAALIVFFLAPLAGLVIGLAQLVLRRDDEIPYGPFLCLATAAVILYWAPIWNWAEPLFGMGGLVPTMLILCLALLGIMLGLWQRVKQRFFAWD